jgi:hypothetical protein
LGGDLVKSAAPLPSCFQYVHGYRPWENLSEILTLTWDQPTIRIFGKETKIPRLTRWFGEAAYTYSGAVNAPAPMPAWLDGLRREIERDTGARFNSALLNYYRDGRDSVAWHADDETELGDRPVIASLSIGATRGFSIKRRSPDAGAWRLPLCGRHAEPDAPGWRRGARLLHRWQAGAPLVGSLPGRWWSRLRREPRRGSGRAVFGRRDRLRKDEP